MALASREHRRAVQEVRRWPPLTAESPSPTPPPPPPLLAYQELDHAGKLMMFTMFLRCEHATKAAICDCQRFTASADSSPSSSISFDDILPQRCTTCHHLAAHHLTRFRTEARNVLQDQALLDDCMRLAIDRFNLISYYAQCASLEKRPYYTLFKLVDAQLYDSGELEHVYLKPPFELPTIDVLIGTVVEENRHHRKHWDVFGPLLLERLDRYIWRKPAPGELLYAYFYELYLAYCLIPKKVPSLVTFKVAHVFGYFTLKTIFHDLKPYLLCNFDLDPSLRGPYEQFLSALQDSLGPTPATPSDDLFRSRMKFDRPRLNTQFLATYGLKINFATYHATSKLSYMPVALLKPGANQSADHSHRPGKKMMKLRNQANLAAGNALYQTRDLIFQRCDCLSHREQDDKIFYASIAYNRELADERTLRAKVQMLLLVDYERLIQEHLPRIDAQYIHDKLFDQRFSHIVIFERAKLIGGCTYALHTVEPGAGKFCEIIFMAVHASKQLRGFGTKMMSLLRFCVSSLIHYKTYVTYADMDALGFYQKLGFDDIAEPDARPYVEALGQFDRARLMKYEERAIVRASHLHFEHYEPTLTGRPADCPIHRQTGPGWPSSCVGQSWLLGFHSTVAVNRQIWYLVQVVKALRQHRKRFLESSFQHFERLEPLLRDVNTVLQHCDGGTTTTEEFPPQRAFYYGLLRFVRECQLRTDAGTEENRIAYAVDAKLKRLYAHYFGSHEYY